MRTIRSVVAICLLVTSVSGWAQFNPDTVKQLIDAGKADEAYQEVVRYRDALEGEPLFDFYYGLAAIDSGRAEEGVFALSRVVMQQPRNGRARLELARGFYLLGEDTRARQEFEAVLAQNPPAGVRSTIQRFLGAISAREATYRTSKTAYVQASVGYDTNINSAPADSPFDIGIVTLSEGAEQIEAAFAQVDAGGQYTSPTSRESALFARADTTWRSHNDSSDFNNGNVTGQAGFTHQGDGHVYKLTLIGQQYVVGDTAFRNLLGAAGEWSRIASPRLRYGASLTYARLIYPEQGYRDGSMVNAGLHAMGTVGAGIWFVNGFAGHEQADEETVRTDAEVERRLLGLRGGLQWPVGASTLITASAMAQQSRYAGKQNWLEDLLVGDATRKRRDDTYLLGEVELRRRFSEHVSLVAAVNYADNDSTVRQFEYDRGQFRVGLRYEQ